MYVVVKGEVDIIKGEDVLTTLPAGVHLGEMALVDNAPRSATARARTDLDILLIRREEFFQHRSRRARHLRPSFSGA